MKIICIGRNYIDHAKELNNPVPASPVFFCKPDTALLQKNQPFFYPDFSKNIHYETEIVVKICRVGKNIEEKFAHRYYEEIGMGIDFTARDLQDAAKAKGLPWEIAKAFDSSAPIGLFVDKNTLADVNAIPFHMELNGKTVQQGNSADMIFSIDKIIAYVSQFFTLKIGDLIFTGTPAGVGPVAVGDNIKAYLNNQLMLDFDIK